MDREVGTYINNPYSAGTQDATQLNHIQQNKVLEFLHLVKIVVKKICDRLPSHVEEDDLIHCGILGLIDAVKRFNWGRDKEKQEFSAYAVVRIRGQIMDELRQHDILSRSSREKVNRFKHAVEHLKHQLKREPKEQEISEHLGIDLETCQHIRAEANFGFQVSVDNKETPAYMLQDLLIKTLDIVSPDTPEGLFHIEEVKRILTDEIELLNEKEKQVISLYYLEEMTLKEIGLALEITESRVSQIHAQSIAKLMRRLQKSFTPETLFNVEGGL